MQASARRSNYLHSPQRHVVKVQSATTAVARFNNVNVLNGQFAFLLLVSVTEGADPFKPPLFEIQLCREPWEETKKESLVRPDTLPNNVNNTSSLFSSPSSIQILPWELLNLFNRANLLCKRHFACWPLRALYLYCPTTLEPCPALTVS